MAAFFKVTKRMYNELRNGLEDELTLEQYQLIDYIATRGEVTSTELADVFSVGKSSITAITTRLTDREILKRNRDESDRRIVYLSLAEYGKELYSRTRSQILDVISTYMVHYSKDEIEGFIQTFEKLANMMEKGSGEC
ncbi:MarR family winged helix-turn-helix transcriptional regulator [Paenibacillus sp. MSJ-6]|uniref:MarR family winged helix-turn-helix transcriptional regulator n=2 Tax=Paenibacillus brevis TaxID=2841508 RepID=A0ABS6FPY8_9BACL|nr:MarR family winged helix-turn-helix transcriptional regulator [Paenibacillus brevis]MBU5672019.1 MarR family winged helix-turn-helix transcriptional regulator [Paenibacillus brevis]